MDRVGLLENEPSSSFRSYETGKKKESSAVEALEGPPLNDYINKEEIFDLVFRLLDQKSLRQTRLVCRKWNDFALQILSKSSGKAEFGFEDGDGIDSKGLERIKKLQSILRFTNYPEMFLSELLLENDVLVGDIQLLNLLQKFGATLKSLRLRYITVNLPILRTMLENWCVNLEELALSCITVTEDNNITVHDFETSPTPLKLQLRKIEVFVAGEMYEIEPEPTPAATCNLIVSIMKSSPKLQVLDAQIRSCQADFWRNLQNIPEITKNLEEVRIEELGCGMEDLSLINDVSFSNKLTSLTLNNIYPHIFPQEPLFTFLEKVGESLEILRLDVVDEGMEGVQRPSWKIVLPSMNKLQVLEYDFCGEVLVYDSNGMDFLKKLPKLEILRVSRRHSTVQSEFLDALISNSSYLPKYPHTTLNNLSITGTRINLIGMGNPENIFQINRMFPKLRTLTLQFHFQSCQNSESRKESWLIRVFTGFSEMKNLKILDLTFPESLPWNGTINFEACFSPLEASKSLEELKIKRFGSEEFPSGLEKVFVRIQKLKVLTLQNFQMKISESIKLFKALDQKGILVKADEYVS